MSGELAPGHALREEEISRQLRISRTPIREALGRLASEGFVERIPRRGCRVPQESFTKLFDLYPIVSALEQLAGRASLALLNAADIAQLREVNDRLHSAVQKPDAPEAVRINDQFHEVLCGKCPNRTLLTLLKDLRSRAKPWETWSYSCKRLGEFSVREHKKIIRLIEKRDLGKALDLVGGHYSNDKPLRKELARRRKEVKLDPTWLLIEKSLRGQDADSRKYEWSVAEPPTLAQPEDIVRFRNRSAERHHAVSDKGT